MHVSRFCCSESIVRKPQVTVQETLPTKSSSKIFGIGLSKTGTNSLALALQTLGYSAIHYPANMMQVEAHDAVTDVSVSASFEDLDRLFPGSKFILTVREEDDWHESARRHYLKRRNHMNEFALSIHHRLYGTFTYDRALFSEAYKRHHTRVQSYFAGRPSDLLRINLCDGSVTWNTLCDFLGKPVPNVAFPWANRTSVTDQILSRVLGYIKEAAVAARVMGVNGEYFESLPPDPRPESELVFDGGRSNAKMIARLVEHVGSAETTATVLKMPLPALENVIKEHTASYERREVAQHPTPE